MENIQEGLILLGVGMPTVFIILILIIYMSKGLIALVNKYVPAEVIQKKAVPAMASATGQVDGQTTAAIILSVSLLTAGKGKVTKIENYKQAIHIL